MGIGRLSVHRDGRFVRNKIRQHGGSVDGRANKNSVNAHGVCVKISELLVHCVVIRQHNRLPFILCWRLFRICVSMCVVGVRSCLMPLMKLDVIFVQSRFQTARLP